MFHRQKTLMTAFALLLVFCLSSGCAILDTALDASTDPRVITIIETLRDLIDAYRLRLENPALIGMDRHTTHECAVALIAKIDIELQKLEALGYTRQASRFRAMLDIPPDGHS